MSEWFQSPVFASYLSGACIWILWIMILLSDNRLLPYQLVFLPSSVGQCEPRQQACKPRWRQIYWSNTCPCSTQNWEQQRQDITISPHRTNKMKLFKTSNALLIFVLCAISLHHRILAADNDDEGKYYNLITSCI